MAARDAPELTSNGHLPTLDTDLAADWHTGTKSIVVAPSIWDIGRVWLSDVQPERVRWLWPGWVPLGKLTILDGDPGTGKSTMTLDLAARVTRGDAMPDGTQGDTAGPAGVVLLSSEDGIGDTVVPRLLAAGADLRGKVILRKLVAGDGWRRRAPDIQDVEVLRADIEKSGALLVVVDPLMAFVDPGVNIYNDRDVRQALEPLRELAEEMGVAIVLVRHPRKSATANAIYAGGGSIGIVATVRSALFCAKDPNDASGERRVLALSKANLTKQGCSLAYRVADAEGASRIEWLGTSMHTADSLVRAAARSLDEGDGSALDEAREFLLDALADGPKLTKEVLREAKEAGITYATLRRAKDELGVRSKKSSVRGGWNWVAPAQRAQESPR